jgi:tetratricopeptide (TPR) repeat protein
MKKTTALWTLTLLICFSSGATAGEHAIRSGHSADLILVARMEAPPQAATGPQWKSRDEYDAYNAMATATDPDKKVALAEAFLQKYSTSDFKSGAYLTEMQVYYSQGKSDKAIDVAKKVLGLDPDNLDALSLLSFAFPFMFDAKDPDAKAKALRADSDARHGLDVLGKLQKPPNVKDSDFNQYVAAKRALFNGTVGFVAVQGKDYANAITALKAAVTDNPSDAFAFERLGVAYLSSTPPDYDNGLWNLARAAVLAKAPSSTAASNAAAMQKYFEQSYVSRHGSNAGEQDVLELAKANANPPEGFKITPAERHKPTGNQAIDFFYSLEDTIKAGGDQATQAWEQTKGQSFGYGGKVVSAEKGPDAGTIIVGIAITDESKASDTADILLRDKQPDAKYLEKGSLVASFKGSIADKTTTPNFSLILDGTIDDESLAAAKEAAQAKPKPKPPAHPPAHPPVRRPVRKPTAPGS